MSSFFSCFPIFLFTLFLQLQKNRFPKENRFFYIASQYYIMKTLFLFLFLFFLFIFDNKNCRHNGDCSHKTRDRKPYVLIVACLYRTGIVLSFLFAGCRRNFSFLFNSHVDRYFPEFFRNCDSFFCLKCSCQFICSCFVCFIHICVPYD